MRLLEIVDDFPVTAARFWAAVLDDTYTRRLYREGLKLRPLQLFRREDDTGVCRRLEFAPAFAPPAWPRAARFAVPVTHVAERLAHPLRIVEESRYDARAGTLTWTTRAPARLRATGVVRLHATTAGVRRTARIEVRAALSVFTSPVEAWAAARLRAGWEQGTRFLRAWLERPSG